MTESESRVTVMLIAQMFPPLGSSLATTLIHEFHSTLTFLISNICW